MVAASGALALNRGSDRQTSTVARSLAAPVLRIDTREGHQALSLDGVVLLAPDASAPAIDGLARLLRREGRPTCEVGPRVPSYVALRLRWPKGILLDVDSGGAAPDCRHPAGTISLVMLGRGARVVSSYGSFSVGGRWSSLPAALRKTMNTYGQTGLAALRIYGNLGVGLDHFSLGCNARTGPYTSILTVFADKRGVVTNVMSGLPDPRCSSSST